MKEVKIIFLKTRCARLIVQAALWPFKGSRRDLFRICMRKKQQLKLMEFNKISWVTFEMSQEQLGILKHKVGDILFSSCQHIQWKDTNKQWMDLTNKYCFFVQRSIYFVPQCHMAPLLSRHINEPQTHNGWHVAFHSTKQQKYLLNEKHLL